MRTTSMSLILGVLVLLASPGAALAQSRQASMDHAGSVGAVVAVSTEYSAIEFADCLACGSTSAFDTFSLALDLGGTLALDTEGSELIAAVRLVRLSEARGEALFAGYRRSFGFDEWKSFFELDLMGTFGPMRSLGARAGIGTMYELSSVLGVWGAAAASFGLGGGRRFGVELGVGLQARSYLLE